MIINKQKQINKIENMNLIKSKNKRVLVVIHTTKGNSFIFGLKEILDLINNKLKEVV